MLSEPTKLQLMQLYRAERSYRPAAEITKQLQTKTIIMVVGATCEGKSTVMEAAAQIDSRFHIAGTFTTRSPRPSDDRTRYSYYPNTDDGLAPLLGAITEHRVVQYAVNPYAHLLYGSMPADYTGTYNLADVFSSAIESFRQVGFGRTVAITVVSQPTEWLTRFEERFPASDPQRRARRDEAIESFKWSLGQIGPDHYWVENVSGNPRAAAQDIINICLGTGEGQLRAKALAASSLETARSIAV